MGTANIDHEKCKGCSLCVYACPVKIIRISDKINLKGYFAAEVSDMSKCTGCAACARMCPDTAIEVER